MRNKFLFSLGIFLLAGIPLFAADDKPLVEGRRIMQEVDSRNRCQYETAGVKMEIIDSKSNTRVRRLKTYKRRVSDGALHTLVRFISPEDVKGTGLLTIERKKGEEDQWLYLPILKKNKRIAAANKRNSFVGTDFTFEDMRPENLSLHDYRLLREEEPEGKACFVIEATPVADEAKYSGYQSRLIWIQKDNYLPLRIEYTDTAGTHIKTEIRQDYKRLASGIWRSDVIVMENLPKKQKTVLSVSDRDTEGVIPESMFTQTELEQGWER